MDSKIYFEANTKISFGIMPDYCSGFFANKACESETFPTPRIPSCRKKTHPTHPFCRKCSSNKNEGCKFIIKTVIKVGDLTEITSFHKFDHDSFVKCEWNESDFNFKNLFPGLFENEDILNLSLITYEEKEMCVEKFRRVIEFYGNGRKYK
jgi:hypothetical protein